MGGTNTAPLAAILDVRQEEKERAESLSLGDFFYKEDLDQNDLKLEQNGSKKICVLHEQISVSSWNK